MTRPEAWTHHAANLLVGGTGLVYAWMLYLVVPEDPFALVNHDWQPELHALHIVTAPLLVFAAAVSWQRHIWARVRAGYPHRRKTGLVLFALFWPMVLSGYLLQVAVDDGLRSAWLVTHLASSGLWMLSYVVHQLSHRPAPEGPVNE
jgi:hypothetical protein